MTTTTEAEVRARVHAEPHDALAWEVYADWLEARGDELAARVVRANVELAALIARASPDALAAARELLALAAPLPRAWLEELAPPGERLAGTAWGGSDGEQYIIAFAAGGALRFLRTSAGTPLTQASLDDNPGAWMQIGHALAFSIQDYSHHDGYVAAPGARLVGIGSNGGAQTWTWELSAFAPGTFTVGAIVPEPTDDVHDGPYVNADADHPLVPARQWAARDD